MYLFCLYMYAFGFEEGVIVVSHESNYELTIHIYACKTLCFTPMDS